MQILTNLHTNGELRLRASAMPSLNAIAEQARKHSFSEQADRVDQRSRELGDPLLIMIVGEGNFGKSTLINALVGRNVAPVSVLPKTWTVDVYEPTENAEEALLYWRSQPETPQRVSIEEARAIWEKEDQHARTSHGETWKSDLWQVRWRYHLAWPARDVLLVDTPGFSQLRSDSQVQSYFLYGGDGIEMTTQDAFQYYYPRADVVLWCLNATKLHDHDTFETLKVASVQEKSIIGVITRIDQVPEVRRSEVLSEAERVFGEYMDDFIMVAAGSKDDELRIKTINELQRKLDDTVVSQASVLKQHATNTFVRRELTDLGVNLDSLADTHIRNLGHFEKFLLDISDPFDRAVRDVTTVWDSVYKQGKNRLPALFDESGEDPKQFGRLVSLRAVDSTSVQIELTRLQARLHAEAMALGYQTAQSVAWERVVLGGESVVRSPVGFSGNIEIAGISSHHFGNVLIDVTTGAARYAAAGGIGAIGPVLGLAIFAGPIGLAIGAVAGGVGAIVGYFQGKQNTRRESISQADTLIKQYCDSQLRSAFHVIAETKRDLENRLDQVLDESFLKHHGRNRLQAREFLNQVDHTYTLLDFEPSGLVPSPTPPISGLLSGIESHYLFLHARQSETFGQVWDSAVTTSWKPELSRVFGICEAHLKEDLALLEEPWAKRLADFAEANLREQQANGKSGSDIITAGIILEYELLVNECNFEGEIRNLVGRHFDPVTQMLSQPISTYSKSTTQHIVISSAVEKMRAAYYRLWDDAKPQRIKKSFQCMVRGTLFFLCLIPCFPGLIILLAVPSDDDKVLAFLYLLVVTGLIFGSRALRFASFRRDARATAVSVVKNIISRMTSKTFSTTILESVTVRNA